MLVVKNEQQFNLPSGNSVTLSRWPNLSEKQTGGKRHAETQRGGHPRGIPRRIQGRAMWDDVHFSSCQHRKTPKSGCFLGVIGAGRLETPLGPLVLPRNGPPPGQTPVDGQKY